MPLHDYSFNDISVEEEENLWNRQACTGFNGALNESRDWGGPYGHIRVHFLKMSKVRVIRVLLETHLLIESNEVVV
jgi:hypothetical protein